MTLLDHGQPADTTTKKHHTGLIAVLAALAVALLAAGAWLVVDRQTEQPLSAEEQQAAMDFLMWAFGLAVALILMVLVAQFDSLALPAIIMFTVVLSLDFWAK